MNLIALVFRKLQTPKINLDKCLKSLGFRGPFDKQPGKRAKALLKSTSVNFYHID